MSGGLDILIVGVAGENLTNLASDEKLNGLFDNLSDSEEEIDQYVNDFHALTENPSLENPRIFYLANEHLLGSQIGAGLGYVIFDGNNNAPPKQLDERVFRRIDELKQRFIHETNEKGLSISPDLVGIYALNVYDT